MRWLFVIVLVGCSAPRGEPIPSWALEVDGHRWNVTLPSKLFRELPMRYASFKLRTEVAVPPGYRGQPLTLAVDCFHSTLGLTVDGTHLTDIGDTGVGEHRFVISAAMTNRDRIGLVLDAHQDRLSLGFGLVPRLVTGTDPGHTTAAKFNRYTAIVELGLIGAFGVLYGALWLFARRRVDAAFVVIAACTAIGPIWQLGLLGELFGWFGPSLLGIALCGANLGVVYYVHAAFDLEPPPKWVVWTFVVIALGHLASGLSFKIAFAMTLVFSAATAVLGLYMLMRLWRVARHGRKHRFTARMFLGVLIGLTVVIAPDLIGLILGLSLFGGVHLVSLGIVVFVLTQAILLARQHAMRTRELEAATAELQRQVAERSRELHAALTELAQRPAVPLEPERVIADRYRVVKKLGAGGMGAVYEVERMTDKQRFALKTLKGRTDPDLLARFAREAQIAAEITHDNLVPVLDVGIADGAMYLVMPLVDGGSLEHHRAKFGDAKWARPLIAQIAKGLAALHERKIVHRDLKPGNVLLSGSAVRIADFGLAALRDDAATQATDVANADTAVNSPLTRAGDVFGTPGYMAPELADGARDVGPPADVFALGVIAYEMLTGKAPFAKPVIHVPPDGPPPADGVPAIVMQCLEMEPEKRPAASLLLEQLV